jgi:hypothetical protein
MLVLDVARNPLTDGSSCCSPSRLSEVARSIALNAGNVLVDCSGIMPVPHE